MAKNGAADILPGSLWQGPYAVVRVLATSEGYVMARQPGRVVWCEHHKMFRRLYKPLPVKGVEK